MTQTAEHILIKGHDAASKTLAELGEAFRKSADAFGAYADALFELRLSGAPSKGTLEWAQRLWRIGA